MIRKYLTLDLLLPIGVAIILVILIFSFLFHLAKTSNKIRLCRSYENITNEEVIFTNGDCYKYLGNETFEKVVFKGVE